MPHNARLTDTDERKRRRRVASSRRAAASFFFFSFLSLAAQAGKLLLSGSLGWAEGVLKCHARNSEAVQLSKS